MSFSKVWRAKAVAARKTEAEKHHGVSYAGFSRQVLGRWVNPLLGNNFVIVDDVTSISPDDLDELAEIVKGHKP